MSTDLNTLNMLSAITATCFFVFFYSWALNSFCSQGHYCVQNHSLMIPHYSEFSNVLESQSLFRSHPAVVFSIVWYFVLTTWYKTLSVHIYKTLQRQGQHWTIFYTAQNFSFNKEKPTTLLSINQFSMKFWFIMKYCSESQDTTDWMRYFILTT